MDTVKLYFEDNCLNSKLWTGVSCESSIEVIEQLVGVVDRTDVTGLSVCELGRCYFCCFVIVLHVQTAIL